MYATTVYYVLTGKNDATHVYFLRTRNFITEYDYLTYEYL